MEKLAILGIIALAAYAIMRPNISEQDIRNYLIEQRDDLTDNYVNAVDNFLQRASQREKSLIQQYMLAAYRMDTAKKSELEPSVISTLAKWGIDPYEYE